MRKQAHLTSLSIFLMLGLIEGRWIHTPVCAFSLWQSTHHIASRKIHYTLMKV